MQEALVDESAAGLSGRPAAASYAPSSTASSVDGEDTASVTNSDATPKALARRHKGKRPPSIFSSVYNGPGLSCAVEGLRPPCRQLRCLCCPGVTICGPH